MKGVACEVAVNLLHDIRYVDNPITNKCQYLGIHILSARALHPHEFSLDGSVHIV
jgi:hypothetical protein